MRGSEGPRCVDHLFTLARDSNVTSVALERLDHFQTLRGVRYLYEQHDLLLVVPPKCGDEATVHFGSKAWPE
jgi:hypothetical protein